jgi:hypothetical protein
MNIDQIIALFQEVEDGTENQKIGFHLHKGIRQATTQTWPTNENNPPTFSGFLQALANAEPPEDQ